MNVYLCFFVVLDSDKIAKLPIAKIKCRVHSGRFCVINVCFLLKGADKVVSGLGVCVPDTCTDDDVTTLVHHSKCID